MPIPPFDVAGNLSVGSLFGPPGGANSLVTTTLAELHERFVQNHHLKRALIWQGWMTHRRMLDQFPVPYVTVVDGSFTTTKTEPGDVDVVILYEAEVANAMPPMQQNDFRRVLDRSTAKRDHMLDLYHFGMYPFASARFVATSLPSLTYWTRAYGVDRQGRQKALLAVIGGGTL